MLMLIGVVLLACLMVMILSGWLGLVTNPLTGESAPPAGVEDLPPIVPPRLPAENPPPDGEDEPDQDSEDERERWLANTAVSSDATTSAGDTSRVVVRRPVTPPASEEESAKSPVLPAPTTLDEALRRLEIIAAERDRLAGENRRLKRELERAGSAP